jgi:hypothetical protein
MDDEIPEEFDLEIEWELIPATIIAAMYLNGRTWDIEGDLRIPTRNEFESKAREMIEALRDFTGGAYITLNGMKVYRDPEFPDSYEIYIQAGYASPRIPQGSP